MRMCSLWVRLAAYFRPNTKLFFKIKCAHNLLEGSAYRDWIRFANMYRSKYPDDPGMHNTGAQQSGDRHTTVGYKSQSTLLERMSQSFTGAMLGIGMFVVSFFILFLNEGKAVQTAYSLDEGLRLVVPITNNKVIFQENNYKLVHLTGNLRTDQPLVDVLFDVSVQAVKLRRDVAMYQWVEHQKKREIDEGSEIRIETDYMYTKEWKPYVVDANGFNNPAHHQNPKEMLVRPMTFVAIHTYVGNYMLKDSLKEKIDAFQPYVPSTQPTNPNVKLMDGIFYQAENPHRPKVGDMRVTFSYSGVSGDKDSPLGPPDKVSIIAKQSGNQLTKYQTEAGDPLELVHFGEKTAEEMILDELYSSNVLTWTLRAGGWLLMFLGLNFMTNIIYTIVDWVPLLRTLVRIGLTAFNICVSLSLTTMTIALGWLWYRPLLSLALLALGLLPVAYSYIKGTNVKHDSHV
ncbi:transmembrane protein 43-like isoform X2 [Patiria miniata]|uniref:Transmembrane protein 43 n=1 Tax=Patiria miniata TaxID=46514 RepID=A0A914AEX3_PATMI|nr:transmembrane protein 43-like isoform X2 [Patiria miniata]